METRLIQETQPKYAYFDVAEDAIVISDSKGEIIYANQAFEAIFGYSVKDILGDGWWHLFPDSSKNLYDQKSEIISLANGISNPSSYIPQEKLITKSTGEKLWTRWTYTQIEEDKVLRTIRDISDFKQLQRELDHIRMQNNILQQEVNHRVKNNMQVVISLLNLQFESITDEKAILALNKSRDRMISISIIHNYLCQLKNLSVRHFGEYLMKILRYLENGHRNGRNIQLKAEFSDQFVNVNHLVSLGLIVSELVTNAYNHAFKTNQEGIITVSLKGQNDGKVVLSVSDNGDGISPPLDLENPSALGYEIILLLVHQIEGRISVSSENGTKVSVVFYQ